MSNVIAALEFAAAAIVSVLVISNPVSTSAVFLTLTEEWDKERKVQTARTACKYSLYILLFFSVTGMFLFSLFGFGVGAFRIAGGIILFAFAMRMIFPKPPEAAAKYPSEIALIPIAIPFISGPATIVTVVLLISDAASFMGGESWAPAVVAFAGVYLAIGITIYVSYLMMVESEAIYERFKEEGHVVLTRLMGLIVMAIAVQFIINGIKDVLPEFMAIVG